MTYYKRIHDIRTHNQKVRFDDELAYLDSHIENDEEADDIFLQRIQQLKTIIHNIDKENDKDKFTIFNEIDKFAYREKWHRLNNVHKINKLREYFEDNEIEEDIQNKLIDLVNAGKLNTKKYVEYDLEKEKIISIPVLKWNKKEKKYSIKLKK